MLSSNTSAVSGDTVYVEDVFSTWLSTGDNSSSRAIVNGIDLATKGGLVWGKRRDSTGNNQLYDTARGVNKYLISNDTGGQGDISPDGVNAFNTNGFSTGVALNTSPYTYAYWTFRKQPKFFDVVTWTGDGTSSKTISHNLGSTPGCIITKRTDTTGEWWSYHTSLGNNKTIRLNSTAALTDAGADLWGVTSTTFTASSTVGANTSAGTYVAYIFAHDAGGFGLTGTDNVISCGSFTGLATVNLGWEPQWILYKTSGSANSGWLMVDNMRGFTSGSADPYLEANSSAAETGGNDLLTITSTGFKNNLFASDTFIYIAIRRGPMKVPTDATKVYSATQVAPGTSYTAGFPPDMAWVKSPKNAVAVGYAGTRLQGNGAYLEMDSTAAEGAFAWQFDAATNTFIQTSAGTPLIEWLFRRAPSFFDEVCYTGNATITAHSHNLGVAPELIFLFQRSPAANIYARLVNPALLGSDKWFYLNQTDEVKTSTNIWNNTAPTASTFTVGASIASNISGTTYVAYLFATCAGVSKVGSYTGTGTTKQVDCGFAAGARFVLIKRTDSTGDWYVWDSARGIVSGNDPYLLLNSTAAEVTSTDYIDTYSAGFEISSTAPAAINASGGSFVYLAIA